jgi:hypothetical protein
MSKDAVNVANTKVPEQVPEQEAPEQVVPKQSLLGTQSLGKSPRPIRACSSRPRPP